jgi:hypothetical protein
MVWYSCGRGLTLLCCSTRARVLFAIRPGMGRGGVINSDTLSRQGAESASALNLARRLRRRRGFGGTPWLASLLFCMAFGMASFALCLLWLILDHHGDLAGLFAG